MNTLRGISGRIFTYSDEDHLLTAGSTTYQYDADGFLLTKTKDGMTTEYVYSSRGELLGVTLPDGKVIEYINDPFGRRIAKKVNGAIVEKYLWQGLTQLLAVYDSSSNLLMRFNYADERMPVSMTAGGNTYYLTYDQVGSLRVVSDSSGNVVKRIDYDSFGNMSDSSPGFAVPFGFAGGLHDKDIGLVRFGFRDYDPDTGRWTAKDPIGFWGGDTDLYGYCLSDPLALVDPYGLGFWFYPDPDEPCKGVYWTPPDDVELALEDPWITPDILIGAGWGSFRLIFTKGTSKAIWKYFLYKRTVIPRKTLGADGATSEIIKETNRLTGKTKKVIHRVTKDGKIVHEDQKFP